VENEKRGGKDKSKILATRWYDKFIEIVSFNEQIV